MSQGLNEKGLPYGQARATFYPMREGLTLTTAALGGGDLAEAQADSELNCLQMTTADTFYWWFDPQGDLWYFDWSQDVHAAVIFKSSGGDADTGIIWKVGIKGVAVDELIGDGASTPDGSCTLDPATISTASDLHKAGPRHLNMPASIADDEIAMLWCELDDDGDASGDEVGLISVRLYGTYNPMSAGGWRDRT
jgi:hypothetical protein